MQVEETEARLAQLRARIRDLGEDMDSYRNKTAAAMGAGSFTGLLALGAIYDLARGNSAMQFALGVTREQFYWIALALTAASLFLLITGIIRHRKRDRESEVRMERLEGELARLTEQKRVLSEE